jgi:hypothetical protein
MARPKKFVPVKLGKFRALIKNLRRHFPLDFKVKVERRPIKDYGFTTFNGASFSIRISRNLDWGGTIDALLHEWAHAKAIEEAYQHDGTWAQMHGRIYEAWTRDFSP